MSELSNDKYWQTIAEIDASYFVLEQMVGRFTNRSAIVQMIDKSTGFDKHQLKEARAIVSSIKRLQAKLPKDDPHFTDAPETRKFVKLASERPTLAKANPNRGGQQ